MERLCQNCLPDHVRLKEKDVQCDQTCAICGTHGESD
jgi:hypothetical protein